MAVSVNQQIADTLTTRHLAVRRVETTLRRQLWDALAVLEADIVAALKAHDPTEFVLLARRLREVETLMDAELDPLIQSRYERLAGLVTAALVRLAQQEAGVVQEAVNDATDAETIAALPAARTLRAGVVATLFPSPTTPTDLSATGAEWWARSAESLSMRLRDQLRVSTSLEESLTQMVARVRGTSEQGFQDGIMARAKQDAARLLTTQVTNGVSEARVAAAAANPGVGMVLQHSSILDSRTSYICLGRHGLRYTIDTHEPIGHTVPYLNGPPYHVSCRSSMLTVLADGGAVTDESLTAWLRRQGTAFQDDLLGPTRAQLWRDGTLTARQLIDATSGKSLTLEELGA